MNKKKNKKKKGFTLIELVIVLAVLAIIALIAIPNFTKVRNDSLKKADIQSAEQIKKITLMAIANEDVKANQATYKLENSTITELPSDKQNIKDSASFNSMVKDVKTPQVNGKKGYCIYVDSQGNVDVYYLNADGTDKEGDKLTK